MQLMIYVKEGKITMQQAVDAVSIIDRKLVNFDCRFFPSEKSYLSIICPSKVKQFEAGRRQNSVERDSSEDQGLCCLYHILAPHLIYPFINITCN